MFVADTHSDTLYEIGVKKTPLDRLMINPDRLKKGGVTLQTFALWSGRQGNQGDYETIAQQELSAVSAFENAGIHQVDDPSQAKEGECSFMLSLEGCEVFEKGLYAVEDWRRKGIRMGALVWNNPNAIGTPAKGEVSVGLTAYGLQVVKEMQRVGIAVDTSHLNEGGFYDLFAKGDRPPMASHSCCRALCDHVRNLTDEQLRLMIREGSFVGVNFYPYFLNQAGQANCENIAQHIDHICQMGGENMVGFGSDFDGIEVTPADLRNTEDMPNLLSCLRKRGYTENALEKIAGKNLLDYFARIQP